MSTGIVSMTVTGNSTAVAKKPQENYATVTIYGTYGTVTFTVEASMNGTNFEQIAAIDNKTGLLIAGGTSIAPSDNTARTYAIPLAQNYAAVRVNVGAIASGTANFLINAEAMEGSPLFSSVAGAAGSFTNITASGTLGVTGAATFSSTVATGALTVTGAATVSTTLAVTGTVTGASSIKSSHATAGIGYATGAGGAVTQITSITTGVTLNTACGTITTVSSTLAAGVDASFVVTNSAVAATDLVIVNTKSYGGTADGIPVAEVQAVGAGSFTINLRNQGAVTLDAVVVLSFAVIKGVAA